MADRQIRILSIADPLLDKIVKQRISEGSLIATRQAVVADLIIKAAKKECK